jgi:hypothetical protein
VPAAGIGVWWNMISTKNGDVTYIFTPAKKGYNTTITKIFQHFLRKYKSYLKIYEWYVNPIPPAVKLPKSPLGWKIYLFPKMSSFIRMTMIELMDWDWNPDEIRKSKKYQSSMNHKRS